MEARWTSVNGIVIKIIAYSGTEDFFCSVEIFDKKVFFVEKEIRILKKIIEEHDIAQLCCDFEKECIEKIFELKQQNKIVELLSDWWLFFKNN
jgi:hypothetical protein